MTTTQLSQWSHKSLFYFGGFQLDNIAENSNNTHVELESVTKEVVDVVSEKNFSPSDGTLENLTLIMEQVVTIVEETKTTTGNQTDVCIQHLIPYICQNSFCNSGTKCV